MSRRTLLRVLAMLAVLGPVRDGETVRSAIASPATPIASGGIEFPGAVPVSMLIRNDGRGADRLLGGATPVAQRVEPFRSRIVAGIRELTPLRDGIAVPPHASLVLEPGADHLLLIALREDLVQGETFPLSLHFAGAGELVVQVRVRRKVDAAGLTPIPPVTVGALSVSLASAPPAPAGTPVALGDR